MSLPSTGLLPKPVSTTPSNIIAWTYTSHPPPLDLHVAPSSLPWIRWLEALGAAVSAECSSKARGSVKDLSGFATKLICTWWQGELGWLGHLGGGPGGRVGLIGDKLWRHCGSLATSPGPHPLARYFVAVPQTWLFQAAAAVGLQRASAHPPSSGLNQCAPPLSPAGLLQSWMSSACLSTRSVSSAAPWQPHSSRACYSWVRA